MSRRQRQVDELRGLCSSGLVARAIDLAFSHFADFGRDEDVLALLGQAVTIVPVAEDVHRRFTELTADR
jgi:hypothetical protein